MNKYILFNKWVEILLHLREKELKKQPSYVLDLHNTTKITQSHIFKVIKEFEKNNLITKEKKGRIVYLTLTKQGRSIANAFLKIKEVLNK